MSMLLTQGAVGIELEEWDENEFGSPTSIAGYCVLNIRNVYANNLVSVLTPPSTCSHFMAPHDKDARGQSG